MTDYGLPEEADVLVKEMAGGAKLPTIAVLGNHDFESGREQEVRQVVATLVADAQSAKTSQPAANAVT